METDDLTRRKRELFEQLFPNCLTETIVDGETRYAIDIPALEAELSTVTADASSERFQFTWPGKSEAKILANSPIRMCLRPCPEESVDFDNTKNIYIKGDNLDVLKLLRETYYRKVKLIYIDPPYNTGSDAFVYGDDYHIKLEEYSDISGDYSKEGYKLYQNLSSNGRIHSDWLNMMYPRLKLSRDFLKDDGVIFISIDDNEQSNLKKLCDEIFGEQNFVGNVIWEKKYSPANDSKWLSDNHDFILIYAKNKSLWHPRLLPRSEEMNSRYSNRDNDPRGPWKSSDMTVKSYSENYDYPITVPSGRIVRPAPGRCWNTYKENYEKMVKDNRIWFGEDGNNTPSVKKFLSEVKDGLVPLTIWKYEDVGHSQEGRQELKKLFGEKGVFDSPKPLRLMKRILHIANLNDDDIVMDFFSGSASTAHSVLEYNLEHDSAISYIMVQIPEKCDESSEAFKENYKTICDLGMARIRLAGTELKSSSIQKTIEMKQRSLDNGFRTFKLDTTNMKDVYYSPKETTQKKLDDIVDTIKSDRNSQDLLIQAMLECSIPLSASIEEKIIDNNKVFIVNNGELVSCFDQNVSESVVTFIAKKAVTYAVLSDRSVDCDSTATNFEQIFKTYNPTVNRRVF